MKLVPAYREARYPERSGARKFGHELSLDIQQCALVFVLVQIAVLHQEE